MKKILPEVRAEVSRKFIDLSSLSKKYEFEQHPHANSFRYLSLIHSEKGGSLFLGWKPTQLLKLKFLETVPGCVVTHSAAAISASFSNFSFEKNSDEKVYVILNREHLSEFFMEMHKSFFVSSDSLNLFPFFAAISLFGLVLFLMI